MLHLYERLVVYASVYDIVSYPYAQSNQLGDDVKLEVVHDIVHFHLIPQVRSKVGKLLWE